MKKVLSIAGSDCSGGAGIQADLKTFAAHGVFGMSAIVSVVAENTTRVLALQDITPDMVKQQIDAVFEDIEVDAVKIGMLSSAECMAAVADRLACYKPPHIVLDPVMYAKGGAALMRENAAHVLVRTVLPLADLVTPNIPEAEVLSGLKIHSQGDMEAAARAIRALGCRQVLVKGGHAAGAATDILFDGERCHYFTAERIDSKNTHGTGCTYSSAIAANLALGQDTKAAIANAKKYITMAIKHALPIGHGHGPTNHFYELYKNGLRPLG